MNPSKLYDLACTETFEPKVAVSTDIEPKFDELLLKRTAERRFDVYNNNNNDSQICKAPYAKLQRR